MAIHNSFNSASESAILFSTDVAARGLSFPGDPIQWVLHADCPSSAKLYSHRIKFVAN